MSIAAFSPVSALIGGALIGLAAAGAWWLLGRLAGVSNILGSAIAEGEGRDWRIAFVAGLLAAGLVAFVAAMIAGILVFRFVLRRTPA